MKVFSVLTILATMTSLACCAQSPQNEAQLTAAYDAAAAIEVAYATSSTANPETVKQAAALLSAAQAALISWQNAPTGSSAEAIALSSAIAALVSFEAEFAVSSKSD